MIKALIFDFGGVVTDRGYLLWMKEEIPNFEKNKLFYNDLSDKYDLGIITHKEFTEIIAKESGIGKDVIWEKIFNKIKVNSELLIIINRLKKKYKIALLTNFHHKPLSELFIKYDLEKYFDLKVISSLHKLHKPDSKIFKKILRLLNIKPEEAIFIDDSQKYINGGKNIGLKSFLFTTNQKLKEDLKSCGVIV